MQGRVLIIDSSKAVVAWLPTALSCSGFEVVVETLENVARSSLPQYGFEVAFYLVTTPGDEGRHVLKSMMAKGFDLPVIMVLMPACEWMTVELLQLGAFDCLQAGCCRELLEGAVLRAQRHRSAGHGTADRIEELERLTSEGVERFEEAMRYLDRSYDVTLAALGDALELRDEETHGHSKRVAAYTIVIAKAMNISAQDLRSMSHGAYLHDIGKIAVPDAILLKCDSLTAEDALTMQAHCELGFWMVRKIPFLRDAAEIVYSHHERWDGTGYPLKLRGEQIPLGARIFALADTLDAITSERTYRRAESFEHAYAEIGKCCGTQFDPEITRMFLSIPVALMRGIRKDAMRRLRDEAESGERARAMMQGEGKRTEVAERHESRGEQIRIETVAAIETWMREDGTFLG